jgi:hypothetical protein
MIKATKTLNEALEFLGVPVEFLCPTIPVIGSTAIDLSSGQLVVCDYRGLGGYEIDWALAKYNLAGHLVGRVNVRRKV